jgi:predicted alpha/beta hydrolase family esterase
MTFGYDSNAFTRPFSKASTGRTFTFAEALLNDLSDNREQNDVWVIAFLEYCTLNADLNFEALERPLIFIGHSLGGIVIKAVRLALQQTQDI